LLVAGIGVLAIPGLAWAGSGGASAGPTSVGIPAVQAGDVPVSATGGGITLVTNASAFVRSGVSVTGSVPAGAAGAAVEIDQLGAIPGSTWVPAAVVPAAADGSFAASWHASPAGPLMIRAVLQSNESSSAAAASAPSVSVTLYRRSIATLYGPGFYGQRTACGVILRRRTIGVANRTLKCGTEVQVYYQGRVLTVPVIDRGPYAHHANWDLTMATGRALGIEGTSMIGAAALPLPPAPAGSAATPTAP
jgi:hypothetical protein